MKVIYPKYVIYYDYDDNRFGFTYNYYVRDLGQVYFTSEEIAKQCLEEFKEDLLEFYKFNMEEWLSESIWYDFKRGKDSYR